MSSNLPKIQYTYKYAPIGLIHMINGPVYIGLFSILLA